jgi:hypothetical protein
MLAIVNSLLACYAYGDKCKKAMVNGVHVLLDGKNEDEEARKARSKRLVVVSSGHGFWLQPDLHFAALRAVA